jgi:thiol-disulfide isomerase/thioredoxin
MRSLSLRKGVAFLATLISSSILHPVFAQTNFPSLVPTVSEKPNRPEALWTHAVQSVKNLGAFRAEYEIVTVYSTPYRDTREIGQIFVTPNGKQRVEIERWRRVDAQSPWEKTGNSSLAITDGKTAWNLTKHPESAQYTESPLTKTWETQNTGKVLPLPLLYGAENPYSNAKYLGEQDFNGEIVQVVAVVEREEQQTIYFDNATGWVRRIEWVHLGKKPTSQGVIRRSITIQQPVALREEEIATSFTFTPPTNAVRVERGETNAEKVLAVGDIAPDFQVEDASGKSVRLSDFAGKTVLLKFWATWCWSCRQSLPRTEQLAKSEAGRDVVVLAVAIWDSRVAFQNWLAKYTQSQNARGGTALHFVYDPQPQGKDTATILYGVKSLPTEILIGKDGRIVAITRGYDGAKKEILQSLNRDQ